MLISTVQYLNKRMINLGLDGKSPKVDNCYRVTIRYCTLSPLILARYAAVPTAYMGYVLSLFVGRDILLLSVLVLGWAGAFDLFCCGCMIVKVFWVDYFPPFCFDVQLALVWLYALACLANNYHVICKQVVQGVVTMVGGNSKLQAAVATGWRQ